MMMVELRFDDIVVEEIASGTVWWQLDADEKAALLRLKSVKEHFQTAAKYSLSLYHFR